MMKRVLAAATLAAAVPALANAWTLNTWAKSRGGIITVTRAVNGPSSGVSQRSANGSQFFNYSTSAGNTTNEVDVTIAADTGYSVKNVWQDGVLLTAPSTSFAFTDGVKHSVYATFQASTVSVTAMAGAGGKVTPASAANMLYGQTLLRDVKFTFTPNPGYSVNPLTLPAGLTQRILDSGQVIVTIPKGYIFNQGAIALSGTFTGVAASAGVPQYVQLPTSKAVTLDATGSQGATTYAWTQLSGPAVTLANASAAQATFTPAAAGTYVFQLGINGVVTTPGQAGYVSGSPLISSVTVNVFSSEAAAAKNLCINCHNSAGIGAGIYSNWSSSVHSRNPKAICAGCHVGNDNGSHPGTVMSTSVDASTFVTKVAGVNGTLAQNVVFCTYCHNGSYGPPHQISATTGLTGMNTTCAQCHTATSSMAQGTGDAHAVNPNPTVVDGTTGCVNCHSFAQKAMAGKVNDNNGVRQIVGAGGEFQQWSHHIINDTTNTTDPIDGQCVVCHLEGKIVSGVGQVDGAVHMSDAKIHLRDCNTGLGQSNSDGTGFAWDPAAPNHTTMDQFCMSCHNAQGAVSAPTPAGTPRQANALNPFGDLIQNNYDGLQRGAVTPVYDQFNPTNTSHHAVRAPRYTANSANTASSNLVNMFPTTVTKVLDQTGAFANISANNRAAGVALNKVANFTNLRYNNGVSYVGTMSDTGKFITTYQPLINANADGSYPTTNGKPNFQTVADNSQLHCGDCHTVGQWAARGTAAFQSYSAAYFAANGYGVTPYYARSIGAHGSGNEYMLRNNNGNNTLNPLALVCYNCHSNTLYGSGSASTATRIKLDISGITSAGLPVNNQSPLNGIPSSMNGNSWTLYNYTSASRAIGINGTGLLNDPQALQRGAAASNATAHDGVASTMNSVHCNDEENNTAGLTGLARLNTKANAPAVFYGYTSGKYPGGGGGNAFGIKCSNCHAGGDGTNPGFGGIHGNSFRDADNSTTVHSNVTYQTYSGTTVNKVSVLGNPTQPVYRFLPGLNNFRYNGGSDFTLAQIWKGGNQVGCYTLNGSNTSTTSPTYPKGHSARYTASNFKIDDNGLLGTWGACTDHAGIDHVPSRNVLRPTTY